MSGQAIGLPIRREKQIAENFMDQVNAKNRTTSHSPVIMAGRMRGGLGLASSGGSFKLSKRAGEYGSNDISDP